MARFQESKFVSDEFSIWGGSLVKGEDGLYHMFYSRWPKKLGWEWVNYSEVAHAVSASPFGPFKHSDVALPERGAAFWDGSATHNPTIHKFDGKYYLYYMGNYGDKKVVSVLKVNKELTGNIEIINELGWPWQTLLTGLGLVVINL
ncbi:hypothetical protein RS130_13205 [Paraglaciecola aquimarina]|uniref:Beta-xylosidase n=1 Tax=Paraglaciecola aquimarina TaxID=1235557 RepID=A0ABU3SXK4_9ALTE|nr:hypothetical protein [Paraglaciecola aquimarina]MDU0354745.1 hypothetical protein [Paraglaciecola aquimarina]